MNSQKLLTFMVVLILSISTLACNSATKVTPTSGTSATSVTSTTAPTSVLPTSAPTSIPPTNTPISQSSQIELGYIISGGNLFSASPAAFVSSESGMMIKIVDVTYNLKETGNLQSYKEIIEYPSGDVAEIEFYDILYGEYGSVEGFTASINGNIVKGLGAKEYQNNQAEVENEKDAFAPMKNVWITEYMPLPNVLIWIPCQGGVVDTESGQSTGRQQIFRQTITCNGNPKKTVEYTDYQYNDVGFLVGLSVNITLSP